MSDEIITESENNSVDVPDREAYHRPLKRDPATGKFVSGTGSRGYLGGRPKGSKDRITAKMLEITSKLIAERGEELLEQVARTDPAAALAIALKMLPNSELIKAHEEERSGTSDGTPMAINIHLTPSLDKPEEHRVERISGPVEALGDIIHDMHGRADDNGAERSIEPVTVEDRIAYQQSLKRSENPAHAAPMPRSDGGYSRTVERAEPGVRVWDEESSEDRDVLRDLYSDDNVI